MKSRKAKVLHKAGGKCLAGHVVDAALELAPPERVFVVVGHQAAEVRAALAPKGVRFVEQAEQRGTGHALMVCREAVSGFDGLLLILYGDCPLLSVQTLRRLVNMQAAGNSAGTLLSAELKDATGYGRVLRGPRGEVESIIEQKDGTPVQLAIRESNMGIYCYQAPLFWKHLNEIGCDNPAGEYYLTTVVERLNQSGNRVQALRIEDGREALGINNRVELAEADAILRGRKARELMLSGVTIERPETVTIDAGVTVGMDTIIEPFARILGNTEIGADCRIGSSSIIVDSKIGDGTLIEPFTVIGTSSVGANANIGPFARLRKDNTVADGAHIGNFVELKNTRLGAGAKSNHLAYLGDATIGAKTNVGAGTITCNYDGKLKHPTLIGAGAFIGSNSTLVAPIEIADGAYVAAGSVITKPVPADALAVGRARQVMKEGWAKARRDSYTKK
jgi:bifunctional UDP-N-acetylglucosamine pyrophosphorylase / glucosamine-1-phosphate N-acetyltransferase